MPDADSDNEFLRRLAWRARRGLLENDLILQRFLIQEGDSIGESEAEALFELLELGDNELMDLILGRKEPEEGRFNANVHAMLERLRQINLPRNRK